MAILGRVPIKAGMKDQEDWVKEVTKRKDSRTRSPPEEASQEEPKERD